MDQLSQGKRKMSGYINAAGWEMKKNLEDRPMNYSA